MKDYAMSSILIAVVLLTLFAVGGIGIYLVQNNQTENDLYENLKGPIEQQITAINENDAEAFQDSYCENEFSISRGEKIVRNYKVVILDNYRVLEENYSEKLNSEYKLVQVDLEIFQENKEPYTITSNFTIVKEHKEWKITRRSVNGCTTCN